MPLTTFASGGFSSLPHCAEWDGTNEADILAWVRDNDDFNAGTDEVNRWQITSTSPDLVLTRPATHPAGYEMVTAGIPVNHWVGIYPHGNGPHLYALHVSPGGRWKTSDPYGRPESLNDLLP